MQCGHSEVAGDVVRLQRERHEKSKEGQGTAKLLIRGQNPKIIT